MKTKEEVEKMLQDYVMKAEGHKRNAKDDLWRLAIARARVCELILGQSYPTMLKARRKRRHENRKIQLKKAWAKNA